MWYFSAIRLNAKPLRYKPQSYVTELIVAGLTDVATDTEKGQTITQNKGVSSTKKFYLDINIAHDRMGHMNEKDLHSTMKQHGIVLTGKLQPCSACLLYKSRIKNISKLSFTQATMPGERIFMDTRGPHEQTLGRHYYWNKICDQYSKMS